MPIWTRSARRSFATPEQPVANLVRRPAPPRAVALLLVFSVAAGCGGGGGGSRAAGPLDFDLRVGITDPGTLDPARANGRAAFLVLKQICDPLVAFDQATGELKPGLAESWTVSDDGKTFRFQLRSGVKFHNGRELVAEDFVFSLMRLADPRTQSPHHYLLEKVAGYSNVRAGINPLLVGVRGGDPRVLEIELSEPHLEFPALMAHPAAGSPVAREELEGSPEKYGKSPTCTGAYRVESNDTPTGPLQITRFDDYYGANGAYSRGGRGYAKRIVFNVKPSLEDSYELLEEDEVDVATISSGDLGRARQEAGRVESGQSGHVSYIGFPVTRPPFDNLDVRRKMAGSINRRSIVNDLLGGSRAEAKGFLPRSSGPVAQQADCPEPEGGGDAQAPSDLLLYLNSGGGHEAWLQSVADDWERDLKSRTTLRTMDWNEYVDFLAGQGADGPFRMSWSVGVPSPEAMLNPLFTTGSPNNFSRYSSSEFDGLLNKARAMVDDEERAKTYAEAAKVLCKDQPILPIWFGLNHVAFGPNVSSVVKSRLDLFGDPILRELRFTG
ncbi:MAG: ABC transporter substrate-binding protein [Actinomycetota bacterium]